MNKQWAECMRCGQRGYAKDIVHDGRNPQLLLLKTCGCWDPKHPAEQPFIPKSSEGKARFPIAPELLPPEIIELEGLSLGGVLAWDPDALDPDMFDDSFWSLGGGIVLAWTRPEMQTVRIEEYEIFRNALGTGFSLLDTNEIEYDDFMAIENEPESYVDASAVSVGTYQFYVEGVADNGRRYRSNTLELEVT